LQITPTVVRTSSQSDTVNRSVQTTLVQSANNKSINNYITLE
jgi:hypothetical protein